MGILTVGVLMFLLLLFVKVSRDFWHPAVVTTTIWTILLVIYNTFEHGLYELSDKFYFALILWILPFTITSLCVSKMTIILPNFLKGDHNNVVNFLYPIVLISLFFAICGLYLKGSYYDTDSFFRGIRAAGVATLNGETEDYQYPIYIDIAMAFADCSLILLLAIFKDKRKKAFYALYIILIVLFFVFRSNKTVIAQLMCALLVLGVFTGKLSHKKVLIFIGIGTVLMLASHLLRGKDVSEFDLIHFISVYFLSPLPAFDSVLNSHFNYIDSFSGEYTFRFFIPFMQIFDGNIEGNLDPFNLHNWTYTPMPVNVYTTMFSYYVDFGLIGIGVFAAVCGCFWGILYKSAKEGYSIGQVLYAAFFYILVFQFFCDYLFMFLGAHIFNVLIAILIYSHFTVHKLKSNE